MSRNHKTKIAAKLGPTPVVSVPCPVSRQEEVKPAAFARFLDVLQERLGLLLAEVVRSLRRVRWSRPTKRLRVCESVPLGDKRFVAIITVDDEQFLLGGSPTNVSLLAQLSPSKTFGSVLQEQSSTRHSCE